MEHALPRLVRRFVGLQKGGVEGARLGWALLRQQRS